MSFFVTNRGATVWVENFYSSQAAAGVSVLVVASSLSLIAVILMLAAILISSFKNEHAFIRSHLGAYFVSLIVSELVQAIGSLMSARWISLRKVELGNFCATQAALKNAGNVSTALWSMVIAFHTFTLVFLRMRVPSWAFYSTLVLTWCFVGFIIILGPAVLETPRSGPFWGVSGYWCWITAGYGVERFAMEYLFMFLTAGISVVLYILIFLRMRGNIEGTGFRITLRRTSSPWQQDTGMSDPQVSRVGKSMLLYPMVYVVLILPIAACRWSEISGSKVPFGVTIFADTVFLLSGLANAILYSTTRRVAPIKTLIPTVKSRKTENESFEPKANGMESFQSGGMENMSKLGHPPFEYVRPRELEEARGDVLPHLETFDVQVVSPSEPPTRSHSVASMHSSVEDAGYPGRKVEHSQAPSSLPVPRSHSRQSSRSNRDAFQKDWI